jgi:hypothetical protein
METKEPLQGVVLVDGDGDFQEAFEPLSDPLLHRYLSKREEVGFVSPMRKSVDSLMVKLNPFSANLSGPEFVPTNAYQLIEQLNTYFPKHKLIFSDFHSLPQTIPGINAPVVQTRYKQSMVPCSTYLVHPGLFDIFFPTDFELLRLMYKRVTGKDSQIVSHKQFMQSNADLEKTRTISGESPILQYYENVSFFTTI